MKRRSCTASTIIKVRTDYNSTNYPSLYRRTVFFLLQSKLSFHLIISVGLRYLFFIFERGKRNMFYNRIHKKRNFFSVFVLHIWSPSAILIRKKITLELQMQYNWWTVFCEDESQLSLFSKQQFLLLRWIIPNFQLPVIFPESSFDSFWGQFCSFFQSHLVFRFVCFLAEIKSKFSHWT